MEVESIYYERFALQRASPHVTRKRRTNTGRILAHSLLDTNKQQIHEYALKRAEMSQVKDGQVTASSAGSSNCADPSLRSRSRMNAYLSFVISEEAEFRDLLCAQHARSNGDGA
jgi:hypothetical protein